MDISLLGFYGYIENIGEISVDILTKISMRRKLFKIQYVICKVWNIGKYGYIDTWILQIYRKYRRNIGGYFDKNINKTNYSKFMEIFGETPKNDKINKNTHVKVIF